MLWHLRYRAPKELVNTWIETESTDEREAVELGHWYVNSLPEPNNRFVFVKPACVATTAQMRDVQSKEADASAQRAREIADRAPVSTAPAPNRRVAPNAVDTQPGGDKATAADETGEAGAAAPAGDPRQQARARVATATQAGRVGQ